MKIIFLPFTFLAVILSGIVLAAAAVSASLLSLLASVAAYIIVRLVVWQESEFLVKCTTILGTRNITEEKHELNQQDS